MKVVARRRIVHRVLCERELARDGPETAVEVVTDQLVDADVVLV